MGVSMEKFIISKNKNVSEEEGKSLTISQGSSTTKSVDVGMNTSLHASLLDFGASVSASFHEGSSHTLSTEQGKEKSWSESIGLNTADSAYYNGNIRYFNRGTAPIYNAEPTTSLVLDTGKKAKTLFTVKTKENQKAQVVKPGDSYPRKGLAPISMRNMDDFGSTPIPLSYDQLNDLEKGTPLSLETDQFAGDYIKVINGNQSSPEPWTYWLTQIEQSSARLILNDGDTETERRIAARTAEGYDQETKPEVTLGEAMELTFGIPKSDKPAYKGDLIQYVFDENTAKEVKKQLKNMGVQADLQNVKLKAGDWGEKLGSLTIEKGQGPDSENVLSISEFGGICQEWIKVLPETNYKVELSVKQDADDGSEVTIASKNGKELGKLAIKEKESNGEFKTYTFHFHSGQNTEVGLYFVYLANSGTTHPMNVTNFKITRR
nr:hypothetical protein [Paenibacillus larvae]